MTDYQHDEPRNADVETLAGFSEPTGAAPAIDLIGATEPRLKPSPAAFRTPPYPNVMERTVEQRLVDLNNEMDRVVLFHQAADDAADRSFDDPAEESRAKTVLAQADRMADVILSEAYAMPARTIREAALKARIMSWHKKFLWDNPEDDEDADCRFVIEDVLALGGLDRFKSQDYAFTELMPSYEGPARISSNEAKMSAPPPAPVPPNSIHALGIEAKGLWECYGRLDAIRDRALRISLEARMEHVNERILMVEEQACFLKAQTVTDAMFQLAMIRDQSDALAAGTKDDFDYGPHMRRITRVVYSIMDVLSGLSGVRPEDIGADAYMAARNNPFEKDLTRLDEDLTPYEVERDDQQAAA